MIQYFDGKYLREILVQDDGLHIMGYDYVDEYQDGYAPSTDYLGEQWYLVFTYDSYMWRAPFTRPTMYYRNSGAEWDEPFTEERVECEQVESIPKTAYVYRAV